MHYAQSNTHSGVDKGKPSPGPAMLSDNILSNASVTDLIKVRNRLFKSFTHADINKVVHFVIMLQNSIEDMERGGWRRLGTISLPNQWLSLGVGGN